MTVLKDSAIVIIKVKSGTGDGRKGREEASEAKSVSLWNCIIK